MESELTDVAGQDMHWNDSMSFQGPMDVGTLLPTDAGPVAEVVLPSLPFSRTVTTTATDCCAMDVAPAGLGAWPSARPTNTAPAARLGVDARLLYAQGDTGQLPTPPAEPRNLPSGFSLRPSASAGLATMAKPTWIPTSVGFGNGGAGCTSTGSTLFSPFTDRLGLQTVAACAGAPLPPQPPAAETALPVAWSPATAALRSHSYSCSGGIRTSGDSSSASLPPAAAVYDSLTAQAPLASPPATDQPNASQPQPQPERQWSVRFGLPAAVATAGARARGHRRHVSVDAHDLVTTASAPVPAPAGSGLFGSPRAAAAAPAELKRPPELDPCELGLGRTAPRSRASSHGTDCGSGTAAASGCGATVQDAAVTVAAEARSESIGKRRATAQQQQRQNEQEAEQEVATEMEDGVSWEEFRGEVRARSESVGGDAWEGAAGSGAACGRGKDGGARERQRGGNGRSSRELLLLDPKRVRRIIANRESAAKSKERKQQYTEQLGQMLDDAAQEREALVQQAERLQVDAVALEGLTTGLRREAAEAAVQLAAAQQHCEALRQQLVAACAVAGRSPAEAMGTAEAAAGVAVGAEAAVGLPDLKGVLEEEVGPEDVATMEAAAVAALSLRQQQEQQQGRQSQVQSHGLRLQQQHLQQQQQQTSQQQHTGHHTLGGGVAAVSAAGLGHHRPTQSADAALMMSLVSKLGMLSGGAAAAGFVPGPLGATLSAVGGITQRPSSGGAAGGLGLGPDAGLGPGLGAGLGPGVHVLPVAEGGRYSLSLPGPIDVARYSTAAQALVAAGGQPLVSVETVSGPALSPAIGFAGGGGGGTVVAEDVVMGKGLEAGVLGFPAAPGLASAAGSCASAGTVSLMTVGACGGGGMASPIGPIGLGGGGSVLGGSARDGGGLLTAELLALTAAAPPTLLAVPSRQVTTAVRPPVITAKPWRP